MAIVTEGPLREADVGCLLCLSDVLRNSGRTEKGGLVNINQLLRGKHHRPKQEGLSLYTGKSRKMISRRFTEPPFLVAPRNACYAVRSTGASAYRHIFQGLLPGVMERVTIIIIIVTHIIIVIIMVVSISDMIVVLLLRLFILLLPIRTLVLLSLLLLLLLLIVS